MQVDLSLSSDTYSNYYSTNGWITTIYIGPSDDLGNPLTGPDTNMTIWETNFEFTLGYVSGGLTTSLTFTNSVRTILSNTLDATGYRPPSSRTSPTAAIMLALRSGSDNCP